MKSRDINLNTFISTPADMLWNISNDYVFSIIYKTISMLLLHTIIILYIWEAILMSKEKKIISHTLYMSIWSVVVARVGIDLLTSISNIEPLDFTNRLVKTWKHVKYFWQVRFYFIISFIENNDIFFGILPIKGVSTLELSSWVPEMPNDFTS